MTEAQGIPADWTPPVGPLGDLTAAAGVRAKELGTVRRRLERIVEALPPVVGFAAALRSGPMVGVIAEIKRQSPSKGILDASLDAAARAAYYVDGGAAALSILTEPTRFGGRIEDLREVRQSVVAPTLRKDFIVHEWQLLESRAAGASAVLLIARALRPERLVALAGMAQDLGLELLIETRSEDELERACAVPHAVIGVNTRDLETLAIDIAVAERLLPLVPRDRVAVYESGVQHVVDVAHAAACGADAVLVGSVLTLASAPIDAVRALASVRRGAARG
ncbi:MAG: indole-3-glycerol-phosphate synthase [Gemmatimonadaceae bacterium]|nr:indole-3-glycerol-phosphate synthase [Gemmatimonadaceae bacterium]